MLKTYGIVGNRIGWEYEDVKNFLDRFKFKKIRIVSGGAAGVDSYAQRYAEENHIPFYVCAPEVSVPSPQRYFERNALIVDRADALIAFDKKEGRSGTKNTISLAKKKGISVIIYDGEKMHG